MLVFFIHGVATQDAKYAQPLENLIREEFNKRGKPCPCFYSSFWGHILKDVGKMWDWIEGDFQEIKKENPKVDLHDIFRYQKFRKEFLFEFFGDAFTYLNSEHGAEIRRLIADQLEYFIKRNPQENELHIVTHSLGSVILWDILFSKNFKSDDPAFKIRRMMEELENSSESVKVYLSSITTMGSPILLFNMMLGTNPEEVKSFADTYPEDNPLRWINIIHSSDIIAYPLRSSLDINSYDNLSFKDKYIQSDANQIEKTLGDFANSKSKVVQAMGLVNPLINEAVAHAPMIAGAGDGHTRYWNCRQTASLITANILGTEDIGTIESDEYTIKMVINCLKQVPGMARPLVSDIRLHVLDETLEEISLKNGSGKLILTINPIRISHIYVFDRYDNCRFSGYVGLIHGNGLKKMVKSIKKSFG
jgi:hypothetical protein